MIFLDAYLPFVKQSILKSCIKDKLLRRNVRFFYFPNPQFCQQPLSSLKILFHLYPLRLVLSRSITIYQINQLIYLMSLFEAFFRRITNDCCDSGCHPEGAPNCAGLFKPHSRLFLYYKHCRSQAGLFGLDKEAIIFIHLLS